MSRNMAWWITPGLLCGLVVGCTATSPRHFGTLVERPTPSLLFDRFPSGERMPATAFTARNTWPSAPAGYGEEEIVSYDELFVDYQGPLNLSRGLIDQTYRRVRVRREKSLYR